MNGITSAAQSMQSAPNTQITSKAGSTSNTYLTELKQKNPGVNITVANFANEKQFDAYMFSTSGANNVVLPTNILEQMAKDPAVAAKYEKLIGEMPENAKATQKYCDDNDSILYGSGMRIDRNGKVTYWAVSGDKKPRINPGTVYKEKVQKQIAEAREKDKAKKAVEKKRVEKAESLKKLMEQISTSAKTVDNDSLAFNVSISDEAKQLYLQKIDNLTSQQDIPFFKTPTKGTFQAAVRDELPVMEIFREGTAEHFIFSALDGKVENAYEMTLRLGDLIYGRGGAKDAETSAIDRETGKKLAEYIAKNYLSGSNEAQSFLDGVNKFAVKSEMRDKGYTVILGSDIEPFKPKFNDLQRFAEEKFGYTDVDWSDTEKCSKIVSAFMSEAMNLARTETKNSQYNEKNLSSLLQNDSTPYMYKEEKSAFNNAFSENENKVQRIIDTTKNLVSGVAVDDSFFANMNTILSSLNPSRATKWSDIFNLLKTQ